MDNINCLTWEEWIRLSDIDHPQVLDNFKLRIQP